MVPAILILRGGELAQSIDTAQISRAIADAGLVTKLELASAISGRKLDMQSFERDLSSGELEALLGDARGQVAVIGVSDELREPMVKVGVALKDGYVGGNGPRGWQDHVKSVIAHDKERHSIKFF